MSRNRNRTGAPNPQDTAPPAHVVNQQTEAFSFVVPTEFVELPSKGQFYPEGHPLHNQETLEIKHMTAREEDMLTSRALLKKGMALERVMQSIIVNKAVDPNSLLVGDRNAILVAARISAYGSQYTTSVTCPACNSAQEYSFNLNEVQPYDGNELTDEVAKNNGDGTFTTILPRTKVEVQFRLLNGIDEKSLLQQVENARKNRKEENTVTRQLRQIIISVNGNTEPENLNYVVNNMPSMDSRHLRYAFKVATPNIDMTKHFECNECDHEQDMEVPLTADFFWPDA